MKLRFSRKGKQFFFATFSLEGRRKLLSRIVEGQQYPELSPCGELVQAALLAVHEVWPAAGISDFSIMPDHVHVLFICDYGKGLKSSPFFMAHCVMDAVEAALAEYGSAKQAVSALCGAEESDKARRKALAAEMAERVRESRALYIAKCRERQTDGASPRTPAAGPDAGAFSSPAPSRARNPPAGASFAPPRILRRPRSGRVRGEAPSFSTDPATSSSPSIRSS